MPRVKGFLRIIRRGGRPGRPVDPDWGIDEGEGLVDPDYGIEEGGNIDNELPEPPPGIWPPLTPEMPWRPIDPGFGVRPPVTPPAGGVGGRPPERPQPGVPVDPDAEVTPPIVLPPGSIWPPLPPGVHGKYLALVLIAGTPGYKYRYVVIDADAKPPRPGRPEHPIAPGGGGGDTPQPKRS